jgi:hypothetical protein
MTRDKVVVMSLPEPEDRSITLEMMSPTLAQIRDELEFGCRCIWAFGMPDWFQYLEFKWLQIKVRLAEQKASAKSITARGAARP